MSAQGAPLIDRFAMGLALQHQPCEQAWRQLVEQAGPGVTYLSLHCSAPGEVEHLHPGDAAFRIAEYELFQDPSFLAWVAGQKVVHDRLSRDPRGLAQVAGFAAERRATRGEVAGQPCESRAGGPGSAIIY